jgi:hypothetical protein
MIYVVIFLCFFLRVLPRLRLKNIFLSDTYFHLYCAEIIRDNGFHLPKRFSRVILNHAYTYPFGYHYFLSLFPLRFRLWFERMTGALFDTVSLILIYLFSAWAVEYFEKDGLCPKAPLIVTLLIAFSPGLLRIGNNPRAYNGSPRVLGQTLYLLHLLGAFYAYTNKDFFILILSLLSGALLIITSKFGSQVFVFFGIGFVLFFDTYYIFLFAGCFLLALLGMRRKAGRVILGHIRHSLFYAKHLQAVFLHPLVKTFPIYCLFLLGQGWRLLNGFQFWDVSKWFLSERYFLHIMVTAYPQFFLIFYYVQQFRMMNHLDHFLLVWMGLALICFLMTTLRPFVFLGESERYLEYAIFPSLFLLVKFLPKGSEGLIGAFLIYSVLYAVLALGQYQRRFRQKNEDFLENEAIFKSLNQLQKGVLFPIGPFHYQALYCTQFPILTHGGNIDERLLSRDEFMLVYGNYPYPSEHFLEIVNRYQVSYIMSAPEFLNHYRERIVKKADDFDRSVQILWETPTLLIGKIRR